MFIRNWRFLTIILTALTTGLAFAHALELPAKLSYDAALYITLAHSLYGGFGSVGAVIDVCALLAVTILSYLIRQRRPTFYWTLVGNLCLLAAFVLWVALVAPVNAELAHWTAATAPQDWIQWRNQWEYTHAARFVLQLLGLCALVFSVLDEIPPQNSGSREEALDWAKRFPNRAVANGHHLLQTYSRPLDRWGDREGNVE